MKTSFATSDRRTKKRQDRTVIRFIEPHVARIERDDGHTLERLLNRKCGGGERRLRLAVGQGTFRQGDGETLIAGGLAETLATTISASGRDVRIVEVLWECNRQQEPKTHWTDQQRRFAEVVAGRGRVYAECSDFSDRVELLKAIGECFPREDVCIAVDTCDDASDIASLLRGSVPQTVYDGMTFSNHFEPEMRVMASRGFALAPSCRIAVAFGTRAASNQRLQAIVGGRSCCIRIALASSKLSLLRPADRTALEIFWGPRRFNSDDHELQLPIHAAILPATAYPASNRRERDALARKQKFIWHNEQRNRHLADIARQLQQQDARALQVTGIDDLGRVVPEPADPGRLRVAIVVESPSHAKALQQKLPGWQVVTDLSQHKTFGIEADGHIVTLPAAQAVGLTAEVVVYAAGTGDRWIDACGGRGWDNGSLQLVVDVADDFDEKARGELDGRVDDYHTRGWLVHVPGQGDVMTDVGGHVTYREPGRAARRPQT